MRRDSRIRICHPIGLVGSDITVTSDKDATMQKKPGSKRIDPGKSLCLTLRYGTTQNLCPRDSEAYSIQAGLLTLESSENRAFPAGLHPTSGILRFSYPITAAGPFPIFTGFPIKLQKERLNKVRTIKESE
jgi:hypothetical protein